MSEDAIRKNVVLIYELLDEVVDYGLPQNTSTEVLKSFVLNEPTVVVPQVRAVAPRVCMRACVWAAGRGAHVPCHRA